MKATIERLAWRIAVRREVCRRVSWIRHSIMRLEAGGRLAQAKLDLREYMSSQQDKMDPAHMRQMLALGGIFGIMGSM